MPSAYEPSGLNQLYSLRYGTPPVVRATGGLADTVTDTTPQTLAAGTATGFRFGGYSAHECWRAVERCMGLYRDYKDEWRKVQRAGMTQDWSWDRSAAEYERLYRRLVGLRGGERWSVPWSDDSAEQFGAARRIIVLERRIPLLIMCSEVT